MNIKDYKWTEKRFGTRFAKILKGLGFSEENTEDIKITDANGKVKTLVTDSNFKSILAKNGTLTEVTWQELKDKRDAGKLTPGSLYRITDYQCTTSQENTRSAGHQFDIVLLALSENKLAEEGWAMEHPTDVYEVTFYDNVTLKCWIYNNNGSINIVKVNTPLGLTVLPSGIEINESNKTAVLINPSAESTSLYDPAEDDEPAWIYNYFQNSNLSAWKVWYCLDNDKSRFAWADDSVDEDVEENIKINGGTTPYFRYIAGDMIYENTKLYAWKSLDDIIRYSKIEEVESGILVYQFLVQGLTPAGSITSYTSYHKGTGPNGRGVIYRLIDEFNNDVAYDFKNIQFKRKLTDGQYDANGTETWCYTLNLWYNNMCQDASIVGNILLNDEGYVTGVYDNKFGYATALDLNFESGNTIAFALGNNVILSLDEGDGYFGINSNIIGNDFYNNTIGTKFNFNIIGNEFYNNIIRNSFRSNIIGNEFFFNKIGNSFYSNSIGNYFGNNTISDDTSYKNYGNNGVELATKDDIGNIETLLNNI